LEEVEVECEVKQGADVGDALVVHDVELGLGVGRGHLVFDDLHFGAVAGDGAIAGFDGTDAADVEAHGGVEFEGLTAWGGFGVAEHDADFFTNLVGEDGAGAGLGDDGSEFPHGGGHEARLGANGGVADFAVEFLAGDEGGDGIQDDDFEGIGADEGFADAQGFLTGAGLGDEEFVHIHAEAAGVTGIESMFDVDEGGEPTGFLGLSDGGEGKGGFTGGFRAVDFDNPAPGEAADPEGLVDEEVAGGDDRDVDDFFVAHAKDGTFAKVFLDLLDREVEVASAGVSEFLSAGVTVFGGGSSHGVRDRIGWMRQKRSRIDVLENTFVPFEGIRKGKCAWKVEFFVVGGWGLEGWVEAW